jgi:hypothetical protein
VNGHPAFVPHLPGPGSCATHLIAYVLTQPAAVWEANFTLLNTRNLADASDGHIAFLNQIYGLGLEENVATGELSRPPDQRIVPPQPSSAEGIWALITVKVGKLLSMLPADQIAHAQQRAGCLTSCENQARVQSQVTGVTLFASPQCGASCP